MKARQRIYCIEGVHDWGDGKDEPTVEPMLELLRRLGFPDYLYRTCATLNELEYRIRNEWNKYCTKGSILLFSTHGGPDKIWLSNDQIITTGMLQEIIKCTGRHVHFSGCNTFGEGKQNLQKFMDKTNAVSVSGFGKTVYWISEDASGLTVELQYLGLLAELASPNITRKKLQKLRDLRDHISKNHPSCDFSMLVRRYNAALPT